MVKSQSFDETKLNFITLGTVYVLGSEIVLVCIGNLAMLNE